MTKEEARQLNPLNLAFIGDTVWEGFIRDAIFPSHCRESAHKLHEICVSFVRAEAQADAINGLLPELTEEEARLYKRGRNAKGARVPRNTNMADYRQATGFEALLGYLYLSEEKERLEFIMKRSYEVLTSKGAKA